MPSTTCGVDHPFADALLLSGDGRYADPWHPFPATSAAIAEILTDQGLAVEVSSDVDKGLAGLNREPLPELLVLNIGDPALNADVDDAEKLNDAGRAGLLRYVKAGHPILAFHSSVTSLRHIPEWEAILGGIWVRGTSFHPEYGPAEVRIARGHPVTNDLADFELEDERYTNLRRSTGITVLATHQHEGIEHPLLWANTYDDARVVYDALGHDGEPFASAGHREAIKNAVRWLLRHPVAE